MSCESNADITSVEEMVVKTKKSDTQRRTERFGKYYISYKEKESLVKVVLHDDANRLLSSLMRESRIQLQIEPYLDEPNKQALFGNLFCTRDIPILEFDKCIGNFYPVSRRWDQTNFYVFTAKMNNGEILYELWEKDKQEQLYRVLTGFSLHNSKTIQLEWNFYPPRTDFRSSILSLIYQFGYVLTSALTEF